MREIDVFVSEFGWGVCPFLVALKVRILLIASQCWDQPHNGPQAKYAVQISSIPYYLLVNFVMQAVTQSQCQTPFF
jgi:hypothetical protein